jgi:ubiquinone/menaquinone biosynthesis C-methylase UbiE
MAKRNLKARDKSPKNSWQGVSKWYNKITKDEGHFYHKNLIIPNLLKLIPINSATKILDLGCGSGILGRSINSNISYLGVDLSKDLILSAQGQDKSKMHKYITGDVSNLNINEDKFSHAFFVLSFQNMENPEKALTNTYIKLITSGKLILVLNHPAFRIPRQSSWGIDQINKIEFRKINKYMSTMKIPIAMNPSKKKTELTWSYHYPISTISNMLKSSGFLIEQIEEWNSPKTSVGKNSKMENVSRNEFPLFMCIVCKKI